jgi:enterochelin esterase-like enzyme
MMWKSAVSTLAVLGLVGAGVLALPAAAQAAGSTFEQGSVESAAIGGPIDYTVYLPAGYDLSGGTRYPTLYLLHGRGDTQAAWQQIGPDLDELIAAGSIPPMVVVMPDAPWSDRGGYYVDSEYTGGGAGVTAAGVAIETAFTTELIPAIDDRYATIDDRASRVVGGYSMGAAGALRYATAHQELFANALILSPAVYTPTPPVDSSAREFGAYGVGDQLFDEQRYLSLNYPATFARFDPASPLHMFIAVGDDEYVNPDPADVNHDIDYESATLYNAAKRVPGITAEFRVYNGGHDWGVWRQGFREGMQNIAGYLQTSPRAPFGGTQLGSAGDDRAGGVVALQSGGGVQAVNAAGELLGSTGAGGLDIVLQRFAADGSQAWATRIGSALDQRAYGVVPSDGESVIAAGYSKVDHAGAVNDDVLVARAGSDGAVLWTSTLGSASAADRAYGVSSDGAGGAYLAGYTSGALDAETSAGDKDAMVSRVDADGRLVWAHQFGSAGEDKAFAASLAPDGGVYVAGTAGSAMPGADSAGGYDAWIAKYSADGSREWLQQFGTESSDQVSALLTTPEGVVAAGFTGGSLSGAAAAGGNDAFVRAFDASGVAVYTTQLGSADDDRAASLVAAANGGVVLVGHTGGRFAQGGAGGVDLFTATLDASGAELARSQFGSPQRDGADEYDESNLFSSNRGDGTAYVQGLSYGAVDGASNAGSGDVFVTTIEVGSDATVPGGGGEGGGDGAGVAAPGSGPSTGAGAAGMLGLTGMDATARLALAALLLLLGASVVVARWRVRRGVG